MGTPSESMVTVRKIFHLPVSQLLHGRVVRRAFNATVPASVVVRAVAVSLGVELVVFMIVRDEVVQRKAIVTSHEVHALLGVASFVAVNLGATE
jgi:hypothetical protein